MLVGVVDLIIVTGLRPFKKPMKYYITLFNNCVIQTMVILVYYLNTIDENKLDKKYLIGTYIY